VFVKFLENLDTDEILFEKISYIPVPYLIMLPKVNSKVLNSHSKTSQPRLKQQ
jgi:hypothetical protein